MRLPTELPRRAWEGFKRHPWLWIAALPALLLLYVALLVPFTPSIGDLRKAKTDKPSVVLSADGKELAVFKRINRDWVKLADISPHVVAALVATEDHRFLQHHGIDFRRTASALVNTLHGDRQGGSTITQQLARNLYPDEIGRAPTVHRKLKEAITALKIEAVYTKDEILETYLNTVPFLYNAFGIEMAARTYFDKPARELDELQSATLIGMLKGTSYYNPVLNPQRALQRRNIVLAQMAKHEKLPADRLALLAKAPMRLNFEPQTEATGAAPHLARILRQWLVEWADRNDYDIHTDGLVVHTTIDSRLQAIATQALVRQANALQSALGNSFPTNADTVNAFVRETSEYKAARGQGQTDEQALKQLKADREFMQALRADKTRLQAGFVAMDPNTGEVKAWVGSRGYDDDQFDHVQQARRQPGSTFKPFVYGAAFEQGASPSETLMDQEVEIPLGNGQVWRPSDGTPPSGEPMTLRDGLAFSKNTITAQVMQRVGPQRVARLAYAMGIRQSKLDEVPSLALGTSPVSLKEMVSAYGTIVNGGNYIEPFVVTRVANREGAVLQNLVPKAPERAMDLAASQTLLAVMRGVIDQGTGTGIRSRFGLTGDLAGKTGTTQNNTDGWFILMHPQLVGGAWVGFNDNRVTMRSNYWGQGAHSALPIVGDFYRQALRAKVLDANARFAVPVQEPGVLDPLLARMNGWLGGLFPKPSQQPGASEPEVFRPPVPQEQQVEAPLELPPSLQRAPDLAGGPMLPRVLEAPQRGAEPVYPSYPARLPYPGQAAYPVPAPAPVYPAAQGYPVYPVPPDSRWPRGGEIARPRDYDRVPPVVPLMPEDARRPEARWPGTVDQPEPVSTARPAAGAEPSTAGATQ